MFSLSSESNIVILCFCLAALACLFFTGGGGELEGGEDDTINLVKVFCFIFLGDSDLLAFSGIEPVI
jgi:hypothetical protein